jgi:hypothetical protein
MKIIDIGQVIDNVDPKGLGRIRAARYNEKIGVLENSVKYTKWDKQDPFLCIPFLPININFVPEIGQSVKILNYNTETDTVNKEYIAGPFTTTHDFNSQSWSQQVENTTYGAATQNSKDIFNQTGEYINPNGHKIENSLAKINDYGLYGKYGSDVIFTENGLQLRGGKLITKEAANSTERNLLFSYPLMSNKISKISLKKFPRSASMTTVDETITSTESKLINTIIEYQVNDLTNPTRIDWFIYKVDPSAGSDYNTNNFVGYIPLSSSTKLLNTDDTSTTPTFSTIISTPEDFDPIVQTYVDIRDTLHMLSTDGLHDTIQDIKLSGILSNNNPLYSKYSNDDLHPLFFRPSANFINKQGNLTNKTQILQNVSLLGVGPESGLIYDRISPSAPVSTQTKSTQYLNVEENSEEQTFAAVTSDKIYFLSTKTNEGSKNVNFDSLDSYEYTQNDYLEKIDPNTYRTVRGDVLLKFLKTVYNLFESHVHNMATPLIQADPNFIDLQTQISTLENDMLNNSIRIN